MKTITPIFPCLIYQHEIEDFNSVRDDFIQYAYDQEKQNPNPVEKSNRGGWQTPDSNFFMADEKFQPLFSWFAEKIKEYKTHIDYDMSKRHDIILNSFWFNINRRFNYNISHHHPNCTLSAVLWIKASKDSGALCFESPHEYAQYSSMYLQKQDFVDKYLACPSYKIVSKEGTMVIFPSHLRHYVEDNLSNEDRISLAVNITLEI